MSCCDDTPTLTAQDVPDATVRTFLLGSITRISILVYQPDDNASLDQQCGDCQSRSTLVIPPTVDIVSATVSFYESPDTTTAILTATPSITDILDDASVQIGWKLSYLVDSTQPPFDTAGRYMCVFTYLLDNGEKSVVPTYFDLVLAGFIPGCGC